MATSNIDEAMKAHAMEAVAAAARHDVVLDYSEHSLADIDELLHRESFVGKTPRGPESHDDGEALWACSKMIGAYLGEVVLRALGGEWVDERTEQGEPRPAIQVGEVRDYPVDKVWRRLTRSASRPLSGYCDQVRAIVYGRGPGSDVEVMQPAEPQLPISTRQLTADDIALMEALSTMFGEAFEEVDTYTGKRPSADYLRRLLGGDSFIALAALADGHVVGGIAAYELRKFEQERSEIYIYDLAVSASHRRMGVATALIGALKKIAVGRGAHAVFVQADTGVEDEAAIALYTKLGVREEVLHFDIALDGESHPG